MKALAFEGHSDVTSGQRCQLGSALAKILGNKTARLQQ